MTYQEALELCTNYVNNADYDFSHLSHKEVCRYSGRVSHAAEILMRSDDAAEAAIGDEIYRIAPALWDYDLSGSFIGCVAWENGYTP